MSVELAHRTLVEDLVEDPDRNTPLGGLFSYPRFAQYVRPPRLDLSDFGSCPDFEVELSEITDLIQRTAGRKRRARTPRAGAPDAPSGFDGRRSSNRAAFVALETTCPTEPATVMASLAASESPSRQVLCRVLLTALILTNLLSLTNDEVLRIVAFVRTLGEQLASYFG